MEIYKPEQDSYLLRESLENYLKDLINNTNNKSEKSSIKQKLENSRSIHKKKSIKPYNININNIKSIHILDMGSGSGIQAQACRELGFKNILTADINPDAVKHLKKQGFNSIQTNLFSRLKNKKFNLIIFNPPYLPENKYDKEPDTTAGKKGYEIIVEFLRQAKFHLEKNGAILLLFSSHSNPKVILKNARDLGYDYDLLSSEKLFFEELYVYVLAF